MKQEKPLTLSKKALRAGLAIAFVVVASRCRVGSELHSPSYFHGELLLPKGRVIAFSTGIEPDPNVMRTFEFMLQRRNESGANTDEEFYQFMLFGKPRLRLKVSHSSYPRR